MATEELINQFESLFSDIPLDSEGDKKREESWLEETISSLYTGEAVIEALLAAPVTVEGISKRGDGFQIADGVSVKFVPVVVVLIAVILLSIGIAALLSSFTALAF
jgi:hypothetical protein